MKNLKNSLTVSILFVATLIAGSSLAFAGAVDGSAFMNSIVGTHNLYGSRGCENLRISFVEGGYVSPSKYTIVTLERVSENSEKLVPVRYAHIDTVNSVSDLEMIASGYNSAFFYGPEQKFEAKITKLPSGQINTVNITITEEPTFLINWGFRCRAK